MCNFNILGISKGIHVTFATLLCLLVHSLAHAEDISTTYALAGTIIDRGSWPTGQSLEIAVIRRTMGSSASELVKVGEQLQDGSVVKEIRPKWVRVSKSGRSILITMDAAGSTGGSYDAPPTPAFDGEFSSPDFDDGVRRLDHMQERERIMRQRGYSSRSDRVKSNVLQRHEDIRGGNIPPPPPPPGYDSFPDDDPAYIDEWQDWDSTQGSGEPFGDGYGRKRAPAFDAFDEVFEDQIRDFDY